MKHLSLLSIAATLMAAGIGCNRTTPVSPIQTITLSPGPGMFGLGYMKGLGKKTAGSPVQSGANVNFDLGSIKGSTAFYFLLYNVGSSPITDVTLSIADTHFTIYPSHIDTLIPGGDMGLLPIVKVVALHGMPYEEIGFRPLMPMGKNRAILQVSGSTKIMQGKDTTVTLSACLNIVALLMNFSLRIDGTIQKDYTQRLGGRSFDTSATLYNTGNVPIDIRIRQWVNETKEYFFDTITGQVAVSDSFSIRLGACEPADAASHATEVYCSAANVVHSSDLPFLPNEYDPIYIEAPLCDNILSHFVMRALGVACADSANALYLIDTSYVFWDRRGSCPDDHYSFTLYSAQSLDSILCRRNDSKTGLQEQCTDQLYHVLLEIITANLSASDLGLGSNHSVQPISIPFY